MFQQGTLWDFDDAISSVESVDGSTLSVLPDGQRSEASGLVPAPVSRTRQPAKAKATTTRETFGRKCSGSSASASLTQSLANKLRQQFATVGSMEYRQTWKEKVTPSGRLYSEHTASARPISDNDFSGWPTPASIDSTSNRETMESKAARGSGGINLSTAATLAGWPTPNVPLGGRVQSDEVTISGKRANGTKAQVGLENVARLAGWASPTAHEKCRSLEFQKGRELNAREALLIGPVSTPSPAETENRGALNPAHSRWLMGYPPEWDACADMVTRLSRKRPPRSSKCSSKAKPDSA